MRMKSTSKLLRVQGGTERIEKRLNRDRDTIRARATEPDIALGIGDLSGEKDRLDPALPPDPFHIGQRHHIWGIRFGGPWRRFRSWSSRMRQSVCWARATGERRNGRLSSIVLSADPPPRSCRQRAK